MANTLHSAFLDRDMWDSLEPDLRITKKLMRSNLSLNDLSVAAASLNALAYHGDGRFALMEAPLCDPNILGFASGLAMQEESVDIVAVLFQAAEGILRRAGEW